MYYHIYKKIQRKYNAFHGINTSIARGGQNGDGQLMIMNATHKGSTPEHTLMVRPAIGNGHLRSLPTETACECEVLGLAKKIISHVQSEHAERGDAHGNTYVRNREGRVSQRHEMCSGEGGREWGKNVRLAWMAAKLVSSNKETRYASAAS